MGVPSGESAGVCGAAGTGAGLRRMGHTRYSIKTLLEVARWHTDMQTVPTSAEDAKYKLNNNHAPFYARLLMAREQELAGFFELRTQTWRRQ